MNNHYVFLDLDLIGDGYFYSDVCEENSRFVNVGISNDNVIWFSDTIKTLNMKNVIIITDQFSYDDRRMLEVLLHMTGAPEINVIRVVKRNSRDLKLCVADTCSEMQIKNYKFTPLYWGGYIERT